MARPKTPEETHAFKVAVSFLPDDYEKVIAYCQKTDRSISWVMRRALKEFLENHQNDQTWD